MRAVFVRNVTTNSGTHGGSFASVEYRTRDHPLYTTKPGHRVRHVVRVQLPCYAVKGRGGGGGGGAAAAAAAARLSEQTEEIP